MKNIILGFLTILVILGMLYYFTKVKEGFMSARQRADLIRTRAERAEAKTLNQISGPARAAGRRGGRWGRWASRACKPYTVVSYGGSRFQKCPRGWRHRGCNQAQRETCENLEQNSTTSRVRSRGRSRTTRPRLPDQIASNYFRVYNAITTRGTPGNYRHSYGRRNNRQFIPTSYRSWRGGRLRRSRNNRRFSRRK